MIILKIVLRFRRIQWQLCKFDFCIDFVISIFRMKIFVKKF